MNDKRLFVFNMLRGLAAILLALAVATVFIFISSDEPLTALKYLLIGPVVSFKATGNVFNTVSFLTILAAMIPTIFSGLAVCVMFSANQFNLGGEGAIMLGGFVGALLGIYLNLNTGLHQVVCVLAGAVAGGLIMLIPAVLKVKLGASEMVTSLMMNYVVMFVILHFLNFVFADRSKGATQTFPILETAKIPEIISNGTKLTWGFAVALIFVVIIALFMYRTKWGYAIRMIGINQS
ncbi:MAG: ABC transporter permease, partial [Chloroflexi bacterium]|nr:ABC transporter permease [Chloroflexota bacterium]